MPFLHIIIVLASFLVAMQQSYSQETTSVICREGASDVVCEAFANGTCVPGLDAASREERLKLMGIEPDSSEFSSILIEFFKSDGIIEAVLALLAALLIAIMTYMDFLSP